MDAITLLRDDHKQVEVLFKAIDKGDLSVVPDVCAALTVHTFLEEKIFYPAVRKDAPDALDMLLESYEEHALVDSLVEQLRGLDDADESYPAKATVLTELVRHHVGEEEADLFPQVRAAMGRKELRELGERMLRQREALTDAVRATA